MFEQWLYNTACVEVKHFHGNNGIFSLEEYRLECSKKKKSQSFSGVGAQHQNSKAERAIQTIMYRLVWAKKVLLAAICLVAGSASFGLREN